MKLLFSLILTLSFFTTSFVASAQGNRIFYNNQQLFLSGANLAWIDFAKDIGPGNTNFDQFADVMLQMHDHGANALRWWLHTDGTLTPEFDNANFIIGPGVGAIEDLRTVLNLAWEREIGLKLCLWSFDMLRSSNDVNVLIRNTLLLTDTAYTRAYINNSLIPMVDSLKGHPGIIAWEIFNEPEGMSNEFGWPNIEHVPMSAIQRVINLCAGAIHRTDPEAQVTNGAWSFLSLSNPESSIIASNINEIRQLNNTKKEKLEDRFFKKYGIVLDAEKILNHFEEAAKIANFNFYSDNILIAEGGDTLGVLDFYSVHYYDWAGTALSPFHFSAAYWSLDKAIVVAEFHMQDTFGVLKEDLFPRLYLFGYAGALPWSWTDPNFSTQQDMLSAMQLMWNNYREDVDVIGIGGDWPIITIINPDSNAVFPEGVDVVIEAEAFDNDGSIASVEFFASDTQKIGEVTDEPYTIIWTNIPPNIYTLSAVATDDQGHQRTSNRVNIRVGSPLYERLEAEHAVRIGGGFSVLSDPTASNGYYLEMRTNVGSITWKLNNVPFEGNYEIKFGYRLSFDRPKIQFINVNGVRVGEITFDSTMNVWLEESMNINLEAGYNEIQMELSWGWMDLDYLAVPSSIVVTYNDNNPEIPLFFSLQQNFPNPFNPNTTIRYSIVNPDHVKLTIYDILGRTVRVLVNERKNPGFHQVLFDGSNLSSGIYYYTIEAGYFIDTKQMLLLK